MDTTDSDRPTRTNISKKYETKDLKVKQQIQYMYDMRKTSRLKLIAPGIASIGGSSSSSSTRLSSSSTRRTRSSQSVSFSFLKYVIITKLYWIFFPREQKMRCKDETRDKSSRVFLNQSLEILMSSKNTPSSSHGRLVAQTLTVEQYFKMLTVNLNPAEESAKRRSKLASWSRIILQQHCSQYIMRHSIIYWDFLFITDSKENAAPKQYTARRHLYNPSPLPVRCELSSLLLNTGCKQGCERSLWFCLLTTSLG